ncbi:leucine-rich repeat domain-containing protein [Flavobacterium sharifuzzamanii]|uniref:leucine-rich repeat domain-containing protein n=1 Tax=Flavobacterium sharifuzzamanii TaxID=2211133 RepID=UPI000DAB4CCB|nr:leucine-rich repeat domain-containing protein [Flavobacterium sharifuzzamanii]KAF2082260.1 leucine-rich repeat domain-containing protein [Flavobacterium sharifuzzamanii]
MNWDNYLLEEKAPCGSIAHLGILEGTVSGIYDLSEINDDAKVLYLSTPVKKSKKNYTNFSSLIGKNNIEAISIDYLDEERISVFSTLPNLKYLQVSSNKQDEIPDLGSLESVEILVLANITRIQSIDFVKNMNNLKTLYIYGINNLYDLTPISQLTNLEELDIEHGKMSGTGKSIKSINPLESLRQLKYLRLALRIEDDSVNLKSLYRLQKLQKIILLPRYMKNKFWEGLIKELPQLI